MGDEDVLRLEVSVDDLLAVHVVKGVADFADDFDGECFVYTAGSDEFLQRTSVYPLHHNAVADGRMTDLSEVLAKSGVGERENDVKVFCEQLFIKQVASEVFFKGLVNEESSVFADTIQLIKPVL